MLNFLETTLSHSTSQAQRKLHYSINVTAEAYAKSYCIRLPKRWHTGAAEETLNSSSYTSLPPGYPLLVARATRSFLSLLFYVFTQRKHKRGL